MPNAFLSLAAAERYARARPYLHPQIIGRIGRHLNLTTPLPSALDVACGTGHSSAALHDIATRVVGTDVSAAMLSYARRAFPDTEFLEAAAEHLPFPDQSFDLVTVSMAFNAFDQERFLAEARRVLVPGGWLALYQSEFMGELAGQPAFGRWFQSVFSGRFPQPGSDAPPLHVDDPDGAGFENASLEAFWPQVEWTPPQLVAYLTTLGRVITPIERGEQSLGATESWLLAQVEPFFADASGVFRFQGHLRFLRRGGV
ncbi:class I SAM-dependent methyltransferase [Deinococcus sp.]|uniref:class I SAM-dependent methyltransferase n=1 Tax=Deinococcus sp. TaxID=47478 RepID=UPI003CC541A7